MKDALGSVQSVLVLGGGSDIAARDVRGAGRPPARTRRARGAQARGRSTDRRRDPRRGRHRRRHRGVRRDRLRDARRRSSTHDVRSVRRLRRGARRVRRARRPGRGRDRRPRPRVEIVRDQLHRRGLGRRCRSRSASSDAGPRHARRALVGRRRAGPQVELRLRLVEGRPRRVLPGPRRRAARDAACT